MSHWPMGQFRSYEHRYSHEIGFEDTSEKGGFPDLGEQLETDDAWQFAVDVSKPEGLWRVHGFFIDSTFYIVWLEEHHRLYPKSSLQRTLDFLA